MGWSKDVLLIVFSDVNVLLCRSQFFLTPTRNNMQAA